MDAHCDDVTNLNENKKLNFADLNLFFKGSPWRDQISNAILQLQEKGDLQELYTKWWEKEDKDLSQKCDNTDDKKKDSANELSLANVGGVFVVLAVGLCLSFIVAILEFIWKARQTSDDNVLFFNLNLRFLLSLFRLLGQAMVELEYFYFIYFILSSFN
jgi:hypothetical protein